MKLFGKELSCNKKVLKRDGKLILRGILMELLQIGVDLVKSLFAEVFRGLLVDLLRCPAPESHRAYRSANATSYQAMLAARYLERYPAAARRVTQDRRYE